MAPTDYTIRTTNWVTIGQHSKSWVIEGSEDEKSWEILIEENSSKFLKGDNFLMHLRYMEDYYDIKKLNHKNCTFQFENYEFKIIKSKLTHLKINFLTEFKKLSNFFFS